MGALGAFSLLGLFAGARGGRPLRPRKTRMWETFCASIDSGRACRVRLSQTNSPTTSTRKTATTATDGLNRRRRRRRRRRHFLSDYELATPTRPPSRPPAILDAAPPPRFVQLGRLLPGAPLVEKLGFGVLLLQL